MTTYLPIHTHPLVFYFLFSSSSPRFAFFLISVLFALRYDSIVYDRHAFPASFLFPPLSLIAPLGAVYASALFLFEFFFSRSRLICMIPNHSPQPSTLNPFLIFRYIDFGILFPCRHLNDAPLIFPSSPPTLRLPPLFFSLSCQSGIVSSMNDFFDANLCILSMLCISSTVRRSFLVFSTEYMPPSRGNSPCFCFLVVTSSNK